MYFCSKTTGKPYSEYECHKKNNAKLVILIKEMTYTTKHVKRKNELK